MADFISEDYKELDALIRKMGWARFIVCLRAFVNDRLQAMSSIGLKAEAEKWVKVCGKVQTIPKNLRI